MKRYIFLTIALLLSATGLNAQNGSRIAVVDIEIIFRDFYKTKIVEANLKKQSDIYKNYSIKLNESLSKLREEFKMFRDASQNLALTEAARESKRLAAADKYRQMMAKEQEIKDYAREKMGQLRDERDRDREKLLQEIRSVISRQAIMRGYDIVLEKSARSITSFPVVLYHTKQVDITEAVVKELNLGHKKPQAKK